jgi:hypothetical protein
MTSRFHLIAFVACNPALVSCGATAPPATVVEAPRTSPTTVRETTSPAEATAKHEADDEKSGRDDSALLVLLPSAKVDIAQGIAEAERHGARAISAKFEIDAGKLALSVYTAKTGIEADAEHNVLAELSGDPGRAEWHPKEEIFTDVKHLTRAAYHLTLVQRAGMSLTTVIAKALAMQPGQVYSIEPAVHERSPIFHVLIATPVGGQLRVDVASGA